MPFINQVAGETRESARIVTRDEGPKGGSERSVQILADFTVVAFALAGVCFLIAAFAGAGGQRMAWVIAAVSCGFWAWVGYVLLAAAADVLRLLKKASGMPFSGEISGATPQTGTVCSACGVSLHSWNSVCPGCGREFVEAPEKPGPTG